MNSFFIPQLGGQIYAMSGMRTQLNLIANSPGVYAGRSSAYSGPGFSDMHFDTIATSRADFDAWIARARHSPLSLDKATYEALAKPSQKDSVTVYAHVDTGSLRRRRRSVHARCGPRPDVWDRADRAFRRIYWSPIACPSGCGVVIMFGKLNLDAVPYHEPIIMGTLAVVVVLGMALLAGVIRMRANGLTFGASGSPRWTTSALV